MANRNSGGRRPGEKPTKVNQSASRNRGATRSTQRGRQPSGGVTPGGYDKEYFNKLLLICCAIGGLVGIVIGLVLVGLFYGTLPNVVVFGLFMGFLSLGVLLGAAISSDRYGKYLWQSLAIALVGAVVMSLAGGVLEFLYEIKFTAPTVITATGDAVNDYIFCIDDSGSMDGSDPDNQRDAAMINLLDTIEEESKVGLLRFSSYADTANMVSIALLDDDQEELLEEAANLHTASGGTNGRAALEAAFEQYEQLDETGRLPIVVLMTDGGFSLNTNKWINKANDAGIIICSIFLGEENYIPDVLYDLAEGTGGVVLNAEDATDLVDKFDELVAVTNRSGFGTQANKRFLLRQRTGRDRWAVFAIVRRVLFFALLGALLGLILCIMLGSDYLSKQIPLGGALGLGCGIIVEVGYLIGLGPIARVGLVLMVIVVANYSKHTWDGHPGTLTRGGADDLKGRKRVPGNSNGGKGNSMSGANRSSRNQRGRTIDRR